MPGSTSDASRISVAEGLPQFLDRCQAKLRDLGARIADDFLVSAS